MQSHTYKGVSMLNTGEGTGVMLEEQEVDTVQGYYGWSPHSEVRIHNLGIFDRATADWINARLRQRYPELSEPLSESELEYIRHEIAEGTL